jgi:hypothetical protein
VATHALPQPSPGLEHPSSGTPALPTTVGAQARAQRRAAAIGSAALAGLLAAMALLAIATASVSSDSVAEAGPHFFPAWLAGPLHGLGLDVSTRGLELVIVAICACYLVALRYATAISSRRLWGTIVLAHLAAALAPPLFSGDVFGYIGFARLDVLHGLSPYVHTAAAAPHDAIYHLLGWTTLTTPYGPLFTLLSDALVPAGIAGGLWTFKALAALASLATVLLIWRAAPRIGRSQRSAIAFYGLNPIVLVFAIPGAHNEALIGMFVAAGALCILSGSELRGGVSLVAASAIKASAALALPFALARALLTQQEKVAGHSVPAEISQLLGLGQLALGVRIVFLALFGGVLVATLWRTWRGSHWLVSYGWTTLALLAATVWLVPWYGLWALLPASLGPSRRLRVATLIACAYLVAMRLAVQNPLSAG